MGRYLRLLRNRPFAVLWGGATVSAMGDSMTWVALVWLAFERGGPRTVAALVVVSTAPVIVGGFAMGIALDRLDRARVLVRVNAVLGVSVASVPVWAALAGEPPTWLLFVVAGLYGFCKMANWAGIPSLIPALVDDDHLNTANAMESVSFGIADVAGPAIAGVLIAMVGAQRVLALDALTYLVFLIALLALRGRLPRVETTATGLGLRPAFRFLRRTPAVFATTVMFMLFNVGEGMLLVLLPTFARRTLDGGAATYGAMLSAFASAALVGSFIVGAVEWRWPLGRSIAVAQTLAGVAFLGLALVGSLGASIATLVVAGLLTAPLTIWAQTIRMRLTPPDMRGRVFGVLRTLMQSTPPIGGAVAGVLLGGPDVVVAVFAMTTVMSVPGMIGLVLPALSRSDDAARRDVST